MTALDGLKYTNEHEWVAVDGDVVTIGVTDYAAQQLGDVVYVDLPGVGETLAAAKVVGEIESTKSVGELYAPVDGEVIETNDEVVTRPELVNEDPFGDGWLMKVRISGPEALEGLLDADEYAKVTGE